jgi:hypothetical protein
MPDLRSEIMKFREEANSRKQRNRDLIHNSFPSQGTPQPSHQGSQSDPPTKQDDPYNYLRPDYYTNPANQEFGSGPGLGIH